MKKIRLTRYMNLEKFITLLSQGIFIPRADMFEDKVEGIVPYPDSNTVGFTIYDDFEIKNLINELKKTRNKEEIFYLISSHIQFYLNKNKAIIQNPYSDFRLMEEISDNMNFLFSNERSTLDKVEATNQLREIFFNLYKETFKSSLISCWYSETHESLPMWNSYTSKNGIAIQTTNVKFEEVIKSEGYTCKSGFVIYPENFEEEFEKWKNPDFFTKNIKNFEKENSISYPDYWFFRKRHCFRFEKEYRFVIDYASLCESLFKRTNPESEKAKGFLLKIKNLDNFIDKIIIAPKASSSFESLINSIANDYKISPKKVCKSKIDSLC